MVQRNLVFTVFLFKCTTDVAWSLLSLPDYQSSWTTMRSQNPGQSRTRMNHGLGEVPLLVSVEVKSVEEPNLDFIFPAVGGCPRDDDNAEPYGGVTYLYDDKEFIVSAPIVANNFDTGKSIYTVNNSYYRGVNSQASDDARVRVRAWKASSLPPPDFNKTAISVRAGSIAANEVYVEADHGINGYPALVLVRVKLLDGQKIGFMSDAVGANLVAYPEGAIYKSRYVVYGYNNRTVRAWISSIRNGVIYEGTDGYDIQTSATVGELEIYAWSEQTLRPAVTIATSVGPDVPGERLEEPMTGLSGKSEELVKVWAESQSGPNAGYRFPGSGALVYSGSSQDTVCTYGGLVYGYSVSAVRLWRPTGTINAGIICIAAVFGNGTNAQRDLDAKVVINVWKESATGRKTASIDHTWEEYTSRDSGYCTVTELGGCEYDTSNLGKIYVEIYHLKT